MAPDSMDGFDFRDDIQGGDDDMASAHTDGLLAMQSVMTGANVNEAKARELLAKTRNFGRSNVDRDPDFPYDGGDNIPWMRMVAAALLEPEEVAVIADGALRKEQTGQVGWARGEPISSNPYTDWRHSAEHALHENPRCAAAHPRLRDNLRRRVALLAAVATPGMVYVGGRMVRAGLMARSCGARSPVERTMYGAGFEFLPGALNEPEVWNRRPGILAAYAIDRSKSFISRTESAILRAFAYNPDERGATTILEMLGDTRPAAEIIIRRYESGATFSCFNGQVPGKQTAPTWAVLVLPGAGLWELPPPIRAVAKGEGQVRLMHAIEVAWREGRSLRTKDGLIHALYPYPQNRIRGGHPAFSSQASGMLGGGVYEVVAGASTWTLDLEALLDGDRLEFEFLLGRTQPPQLGSFRGAGSWSYRSAKGP